MTGLTLNIVIGLDFHQVCRSHSYTLLPPPSPLSIYTLSPIIKEVATYTQMGMLMCTCRALRFLVNPLYADDHYSGHAFLIWNCKSNSCSLTTLECTSLDSL